MLNAKLLLRKLDKLGSILTKLFIKLTRDGNVIDCSNIY